MTFTFSAFLLMSAFPAALSILLSLRWRCNATFVKSLLGFGLSRVHVLAFQSLADQLHLLDLIDQLTIFVIDPILVQFTAIDVVTAATLCSRAPKNEQLLVFLVVADRLGPAGL